MIKIKKNPITAIAAHIIVWLVVFVLPFLLSSEENISWESLSKTPWSIIIAVVAVFYINYFLLIDKFILKKKYLIFTLLNVLIMAVFILLLNSLRPFTMGPLPDFVNDKFMDHRPPGHSMLFMFAFKDFITLTIPLIFCIAIKVTQQLINTERERERMEKENIKSTLMLLKYQVQPHFFFNSLNNIYALIENAPDHAKEALYNLSKLMRYMLYEKEYVRLDEEIEFLKKYISLMGLRLRENVKVEVTFPENAEKYQVVPFLFIPLIENAYKHGISSTEGSGIVIEMKIENKRIHFFVTNTCFPKTEYDKSGSGIGLQNLNQRLKLIYPGRHKFIKTIENNIFKTELIIDAEVI